MMEWTEGLIVLTRLLEGNVLRDDFDNVDPLPDGVDCFREASRQVDHLSTSRLSQTTLASSQRPPGFDSKPTANH